MSFFNPKKIIMGLILSFLLISCASNIDPIYKETESWNAAKIYQQANAELADHNYHRAIKLYGVLESIYPYDLYAQKGMLDLSYAYYQNEQKPLAQNTLEQFMHTYPTSVNMDYALYLNAYINYGVNQGFLANFGGQDLSERDPQNLIVAYNGFYQLITQYPRSKYSTDAKIKINILVDALSRGGIDKARYYMSIAAYLAAINRASSVIKDYPHTARIEEALAITIQAYQSLGENLKAQQNKKILALNFPRSQYLIKAWSYQALPWYQFWQ